MCRRKRLPSRNYMIRCVVVLLVLGAVHGAPAQAQQGAGGIPPVLAQKQALARSMVEDASTAERIKASQDAEAMRLYSLAKEAYARALAATKDGDFPAAEKQLNQVMSAIGKARRLAPDTAALAVKQLAEYKAKLESVESLEKSYLGNLKNAKQKPGATNSETEASAKMGISRLMEAARKHASENRLGDALRALEKAEQVMRSAMNRIMDSVEIEYTQKFDTPAEEYAFELERNRSYLEAIPVAIAEFKPTDEAKLNINNMVEQNREAVEQARVYAGKKDYNQALANVRTGTEYLLNALAVAGLVLLQ